MARDHERGCDDAREGCAKQLDVAHELAFVVGVTTPRRIVVCRDRTLWKGYTSACVRDEREEDVVLRYIWSVYGRTNGRYSGPNQGVCLNDKNPGWPTEGNSSMLSWPDGTILMSSPLGGYRREGDQQDSGEGSTRVQYRIADK